MNQKKSISIINKNQWLEDIAQSIQLREGIQGVSKALWVLYQGKAYSTREWARQIHIPVPVLAALRRELEKKNILSHAKHLQVTDEGREIFQHIFGAQTIPETLCPTCRGRTHILPAEAYPVLEEYSSLVSTRPDIDVTLDQSHATPETGIRKALLLLEKGLLAESIFFLGDDDAISLACLLVRKHFMSEPNKTGPLLVADIDQRYLDYLSNISEGQIQTIEYDVRHELPENLLDSFTVTLTDPAYTENGITLFSYRCLAACQKGGTLLLSMPFPEPTILRNIEFNLLQMGWAVREILPRFNEYLGASIHAHVSSLIICEHVCDGTPENSLTLRYTPLYTGELRSPGGEYECTICGTRYTVGPQEEYKTIRELKQDGCVECGNQFFDRIGKIDEN